MTELSPSHAPGDVRGPGHCLYLFAALASGCLAFGAKLMLIDRYGTDVPYWDEWDAVGGVLLMPWAHNNLHLADFLHPHNEHRIVFTRLASLVLAAWNRQWDPLLEMSANALIHAGFCAALVLLAGRLVSGARFAVVAAATTILFCLAFDWENTLEGFQSQFYFLEWGALGMFLLCVPAAPLGRRWWGGWLFGLASLGTMASGFLASSALLAVMAFRAAVERRWSRRDTVAVVLLLGLCVGGLLSVTPNPYHQVYKAHSLGQWLAGLAALLSWPISGWRGAFLVIQAPACLLVANRVRSRRLGGDEAVLVALAFWGWLQIAVLAYGRVNYGLGNSRYTDVLAVGLFANCVSLFVLWKRGHGGILLGSAAAAWMALLAAGLWGLDHRAHTEVLGGYPALKSAERRHISAFLASGDVDGLRAAPPRELPYPSPEILGRYLSAGEIRAMLPVGIRPAIGLTADTGSGGFAVTDSRGLPPGAGGRIWIARAGPAFFFSQRLAASGPSFAQIEFCGSPDLAGTVLRLESTDGDEYPPATPLSADHWQAFDFSLPRGMPGRLVVEIPPGNHWFAFPEPVELGAGSWANRWLLRRSGAVAAISGVLLAGILIAIAGGGGKREIPESPGSGQPFPGTPERAKPLDPALI